MDKLAFTSTIQKPATVLEVGGFRPPESIFASWFGKILVGKKDEPWPTSNGEPMIPICQLNLTEIDLIPKSLDGIAFLSVFVDLDSIPLDTENGDGWCIRTYHRLDELVEIEAPAYSQVLKPFPIQSRGVSKDFPAFEDCPVEIPLEFDEAYSELFPTLDGFKLGGWPQLIQAEINWHDPQEAEPVFAFQIDSVPKGHLQWGDGGVAYFGRGTKPGKEHIWSFDWQCF